MNFGEMKNRLTVVRADLLNLEDEAMENGWLDIAEACAFANTAISTARRDLTYRNMKFASNEER